MKRYEQYKDSGVAWIGEIPAHWETVKPKYTVFLQKGTKPQELTNEDNGNLPYLTMDVLRDRANKTTMYPTSVNDLVKVDDGDILVLWDGANAGEVLLAKEGYLSSTMARFGFDTDKLDSRYWFYFLKGLEPILKEFAGGTTIPHLDSSKIMEEAYPIPSMEEQQAIVHYLDYKVAKIDKLIFENEAQVKELEKYRTAVISEVVTKGLNPNVPMRDSGIQWIGEIPAHWEVSKPARLFQTGSGTTPNTDNYAYYSEQGINWLQTGDLNDGIINCTAKKITYKAIEDKGMRIYPKGSVVIAMYGATIGKLGLLNIECAVNQACCVLSEGHNMLNEFVFYVFCAAKSDLIHQASGGGQPNINQQIIRQQSIPLPPLQEQEDIVEYINGKAGMINDLIAAIDAQIKQLNTYKTTLISEAVTGQIDVRDWQEK